MNEQIGWFGKMPAMGDFAQRRLPPEFVQGWDPWLQRGLAESRSRLGADWQELYLTFPVWRFVLPPGWFGSSGWCGILMPSVDRVGRHFPLTICHSMNAQAFGASSLDELDVLLDGFTDAGLAALDGMGVESFELRLGVLRRPKLLDTDGLVTPDTFRAGGGTGLWPLDAPLSMTLGRAAGCMLLSALGGRALWWVPAAGDTAGQMRREPLPLNPALLTDLIGSGDAQA